MSQQAGELYEKDLKWKDMYETNMGIVFLS
jgi:hypothetical protein